MRYKVRIKNNNGFKTVLIDVKSIIEIPTVIQNNFDAEEKDIEGIIKLD